MADGVGHLDFGPRPTFNLLHEEEDEEEKSYDDDVDEVQHSAQHSTYSDDDEDEKYYDDDHDHDNGPTFNLFS